MRPPGAGARVWDDVRGVLARHAATPSSPVTTTSRPTPATVTWRPHRHRTRGPGHLPRGVVPVADHQPVSGPVDLVGVSVDVGGNLGLQGGEHRPGAVPDQLIQRRPADPGREVHSGLGVLLGCLEHGRTFPNQRVNAGS